MTLTTDTQTEQITDHERAERLDRVGGQWVSKIEADASKAAVSFAATGQAFGSVASAIETGDHSFVIDEPAGLGGDNLGANPVETALGALISCQIVTYRVWAHNLGIAIDDVSIESSGDIDLQGFFGLKEGVRPGFSGISLTVTVSGPETKERYEQLQDAVDKHCPVLDLFSSPTPVETTLVVA